jgi:hypothetical protein
VGVVVGVRNSLVTHVALSIAERKVLGC